MIYPHNLDNKLPWKDRYLNGHEKKNLILHLDAKFWIIVSVFNTFYILT